MKINRRFLVLFAFLTFGIAITGTVVGTSYRAGLRSDETVEKALKKLVEKYRIRNDFVLKWFPVIKQVSDPSLLLSFEQAAFLDFDRLEQILSAEITKQMTKTKKVESSPWGKIEREISDARANYTASAYDRNETWARFPNFLRNWLSIRPYPHFRADLIEFKRLKGVDPNPTN